MIKKLQEILILIIKSLAVEVSALITEIEEIEILHKVTATNKE